MLDTRGRRRQDVQVAEGGEVKSGISESRIREVVADLLGLHAEDLKRDVSLTDDLAADSLDLAELTISLEEEFDVGLEAVLDHVRTYGDLVDTVLRAIRGQRAVDMTNLPIPVQVRARLRPAGETAPSLVHTGPLTPYLIESILEDARRAGEGSVLEVTIPASATNVDLDRVAARFTPLDEKGVKVAVRRDGQAGAANGRAATRA